MMRPPGPTIPELTTERLVLRGHTRADFEDSAALWGDPVVTRFIGGRPFSAEETWGRLLRHLGHWALQGYGYWVVRERATGRFVGEVGLIDLHRDLEPELGDTPEAGWVLAPWCFGQGFATEAMTAVLTWSHDVLAAPRVVCIIDPGHEASLRVAARCGFQRLGVALYHSAPVVVLERWHPGAARAVVTET